MEAKVRSFPFSPNFSKLLKCFIKVKVTEPPVEFDLCLRSRRVRGQKTSRLKLEDLAPQIQTFARPYHTLESPAMLKLAIYFDYFHLFI